MFYHLFYDLHSAFPAFRVFRYITFRSLMAMLTALAISLILGPWLIAFLRKYQIGQIIREDGPKGHMSKQGTPTMGGVLILLSLLLSFFLWARWDNPYVWITALGTLMFGAIGFIDDYRKVRKKHNKGLGIREKFRLQVLAGILLGLALLWAGLPTSISFPFFKDVHVDFGWGFVPFAALVIVAASNAVNLTDGLDGLAVGPTLVSALTFTLLTYIAGHYELSSYLQVMHVKEAGELAIFCSALAGAGLGFLWFNTYPAQVFMGDVGSLALGAALGLVALVAKQEFLLVLVGGVFVLEAASVIVQVISFRTTGKRVFKMAPIHHHFELKGWAEPKVIVRFWIISIVLAVIGLSTLKLR